MIEIILLVVALLIVLYRIIGRFFHFFLFDVLVVSRIASRVFHMLVKGWRLTLSMLASALSATLILAINGFGLEVMPALHPLSWETACISWLLHGFSTTLTVSSVLWLFHGPFHLGFVAASSLFLGMAAWFTLNRSWWHAASCTLLGVVAVATLHVKPILPAIPQLAAPLLLATALTAIAILFLRYTRKTVYNCFKASYSMHASGRVLCGVKENGKVRPVMLAVGDGEAVHILISGASMDEFEWKVKLLGGAENCRVIVSREVKKAWKRYVHREDPQPAVTLLLNMLNTET